MRAVQALARSVVRRRRLSIIAVSLTFLLAAGAACRADAAIRVFQLTPARQGGSESGKLNVPSFALMDPALASKAPLVLFLTGTGGRPNYRLPLLQFLAERGFRVLALSYDDVPAVSQVCPRDPDPACSGDFREMRIYGTGASTVVKNPPEEAILPRLVDALQSLASANPQFGWADYLEDGQPRWGRLVLTGLSQGAGMAAYMAMRHPVQRVVLFSSPWDVTGHDHHPAPWLTGPSLTPRERWYAEYSSRETTSALIRAAYAALRIPADHIEVFSRDLPPGGGGGDNPYHVVTIRDPGYAPQWAKMFGRPSDP